MPYLKIISIDGKKRIVELKPKRYAIGRGSDKELQLDDPTVSRTHAELFKFGDHFVIRDLDATNGIYVNNEKATEEILKDKDEVIIGATLLVYHDFLEEGELNEAASGEEIITDTFVLNEKKPAPSMVEVKYDESSFEILNEFAEVMGELEGDGNFYSFIAEKIASLLDAQHVYIFHLDKVDEKTEPKGFYSEQGKESMYSKTIIKTAVKSGKAIATSNALEDEKFSFSESIVIKRIGSVICVPVLSGKIKIVLYCQRENAKGPFHQDQLNLAVPLTFILWAYTQKS